MRARSHVAFYLVFAALTVAAPDTFADVFTAVTVQDDIRLVIDTNDGHSTMLQLDGEAQAFSAPAISPDGAAVGWLVHYPFCCTSYPIPLRLTILSAGTEHTFTGNGLPIWKWRFLGDGSQVAFLQQTVRGDSSVHYELRDVESGDLRRDPAPCFSKHGILLASRRAKLKNQ